jgi:SPX domain protein involved in polyphosphate accumulation
LEPSNNWRYERKFVISSVKKHEIAAMLKLHPALFSEVYPERKVNSLYFDSFAMGSVFDNAAGRSDRKKVRLRWYGDLCGLIENPILEIKAKQGNVGHKLSFRIKEFIMDKSLNVHMISKLVEESSIPGVIKMGLLNLRYVLITSYRRRYFESRDRAFRITVDSEIEYIKVDPSENSFLNRFADRNRIIVELKYNKERDPHAEKITNWFNFRLSKNSKYVEAVEHLYQLC